MKRNLLIFFVLLFVSWIAKADMNSYTLTPTDNSTVDKIVSVKITFTNTLMGIGMTPDVSGVTLTNQNSGKVYNAIKYDNIFDNYAVMYFDLENATEKQAMDIVEPGTYALKIPAGTFSEFFSSNVCPEITATYVIASIGGDYMSSCVVSPPAGTVEKISAVSLSFNDALDAVDIVPGVQASDIKIVKKGARGKTYNCISMTKSVSDSKVIDLAFALDGETDATEILKSGEYLLSVPSGMFQCSGGKNDALSILYKIPVPTSSTSLVNYAMTPAEGSVVSEFSEVTITFPDTNEGLEYPFDYSNVKLKVRKYSDGNQETEMSVVGVFSSVDANWATFKFVDNIGFTDMGEYTVVIPSGTFHEAGNQNATNVDINATYIIPAPAESIALNKTEAELTVGETETLTVTFAPEYTTDKSLTWTSSDESVATVSEGGTVSAVKAGTATITATTTNGKTAECVVTVVQPAESIVLDKSEAELHVGETLTLVATVSPDDTTDKGLAWTSSDESVALVSAEGEIEAVALGTATITVRTTDGSGLSAECVVEVTPILATSIALSETEKEAVEGTEFTLVATVLPDDATDKTVEWSSSDTGVATVDAGGLVKVIAAGECRIVAKTTDGSGLSAACALKAVSGIESILMDADGCCDVYDVKGVLVKRNATAADIKALRAGIYIIGGRKYNVK